VRVGPRTITAPAGSFVVVPRGVHQPANLGTQPTKVSLISSPAGMDRFFEEMAERYMPLQAVPTSSEVLEELATFTEKYGYEFAEFYRRGRRVSVLLRSRRGHRGTDELQRIPYFHTLW
jgi:hypothetical protein